MDVLGTAQHQLRERFGALTAVALHLTTNHRAAKRLVKEVHTGARSVGPKPPLPMPSSRH
jgi:hypothetical protein